jgi:hypothetical protein
MRALSRQLGSACGVLLLAALACGPAAGGSDDTSSTGASATDTGSATFATSTSSSTSSSGTSTSLGETSSTTATDESTTSSCPHTQCGDHDLECTDGQDNDGDGLFDLDDPECTSVCDQDEGSFQTGFPVGADPCSVDCFFDTNTGSGDDTCRWHIDCDPENPGADFGCAYTASGSCEYNPPEFGEECLAFCTPFVLPGCDCVGCCTIATPDGPRNVSLVGDPDCTADDLASCATCTSQIEECGNVCTPDSCEICFGGELPEGCVTNVCDDGSPPCATTADCPCGEFCKLGCCWPVPP